MLDSLEYLSFRGRWQRKETFVTSNIMGTRLSDFMTQNCPIRRTWITYHRFRSCSHRGGSSATYDSLDKTCCFFTNFHKVNHAHECKSTRTNSIQIFHELAQSHYVCCWGNAMTKPPFLCIDKYEHQANYACRQVVVQDVLEETSTDHMDLGRHSR